jgi:hypothetical protein
MHEQAETCRDIRTKKLSLSVWLGCGPCQAMESLRVIVEVCTLVLSRMGCSSMSLNGF